MPDVGKLDKSEQQALQQAAYTLSWMRIWEQVIINVLSAMALTALSVGGALLLLLYQRLTSYIVVPTNVLIAVLFLSLGALVMLVVIALVAYLTFEVSMRRSRPFAYALMLGLIGYALASGGVLETLRKAFSHAATNERDNTNTPHVAE